MESPAEGVSGPLVIGAEWLLEMLRNERRRWTVGYYWAPFSIIHEIPEMSSMWNCRFVGFSTQGKPPAAWLTASTMRSCVSSSR